MSRKKSITPDDLSEVMNHLRNSDMSHSDKIAYLVNSHKVTRAVAFQAVLLDFKSRHFRTGAR